MEPIRALASQAASAPADDPLRSGRLSLEQGGRLESRPTRSEAPRGEPSREPSEGQSPSARARGLAELATPLRTLVRCRVCGFAEVHTDEVVHRGTLILAECPRCEHRWTAPAEAPPLPGPRLRRVRSARRSDGEAAAAA